MLIAAGVAAIAVAAGATFWSLETRQAKPESVAASDAEPTRHVGGVSDAVELPATTAPASTADVQAQAPMQEDPGVADPALDSATEPPPAVSKEKPQQLEEKRTVPAQRVVAVDPNPATLQPAMNTAAAVAAPPAAASSSGLDQVRKGETTQGDLIRLFGGPNLTTFDEAGRETWVYERTQTQTDVSSSSQAAQATARLGLFFGSVAVGGAAEKSASTQSMTTTQAVRSVTVIVKFAPDRTVYDYAVRETYF